MMSSFSRIAECLSFLAMVAAGGCGGDSIPTSTMRQATLPPPTGGERVLFVGNSLTEANDMTLMVEALSHAGGHPLAVEAVTYGGFALEDHWNLGTQNRIAAGGFRFVVLQQGPSALPESRANLREWTRRFDTVIRQAGGRTALYMVWPESYRPEAFPEVSASYRLAAEDVSGTLLPAGDAWVAAWRQDPGFALYGPDGFHPTVLGSYLAALVIYGGLANASPSGLPARLQLRNGRSVEVSAREAAIAQAAAAEALAQTGVVTGARP
jgi:hypothetical protein